MGPNLSKSKIIGFIGLELFKSRFKKIKKQDKAEIHRVL